MNQYRIIRNQYNRFYIQRFNVVHSQWVSLGEDYFDTKNTAIDYLDTLKFLIQNPDAEETVVYENEF